MSSVRSPISVLNIAPLIPHRTKPWIIRTVNSGKELFASITAMQAQVLVETAIGKVL